MGVKRKANTEPDDAFSAVFGDIDQSPIMRQSGDAAETPDNARDLEMFEGREPEEPEDPALEMFENQGPEGFEDLEPKEAGDQEPEEPEDQGLEDDQAADVPAEETVSMEVTEQDNGRTIAPPGDLKGEAAGKLMAVLLESLEKDLAHYRLDLGKVREMDASGLSVLVCFAETLKSRGQGLEIINVSQDLQNLFSASRLDKTYGFSFS